MRRGESMGWGVKSFSGADETRYHELPEQVVIGEGPKKKWGWLMGIGAAAAVLLLMKGGK